MKGSPALRLFALATLSAPSFATAGETPQEWYSEGRATILEAEALEPIKTPARNVILFVGDGMGISTVTAGRIFEGQLRGGSGEENDLAFETLPYAALAKTYNTDQQTPDSAGTMTALITGYKTKAGFISVSQAASRADGASAKGAELLTLLEKAEIAGKATGVVSTARITHATPAACYAHVPDRDWESDSKVPSGQDAKDIAAQLIDMPADWAARGFPQIDGLEVALGGGRASFFPAGAIGPEYSREQDEGNRGDGRNLVDEWLSARAGAAYVHDLDGFRALDPAKSGPILGLFQSSHMQYETDRAKDAAGEPSLAEMTSLAIDILDRREEGYFLMVEAGRIDHAHHAGNAYRALMDTVALSEAVRVAMEKTDPRETLIVVTADHSHVFTMAGYPARGNSIVGLVADARGELARDALGKPYTTLGYANGPGYVGASDVQPEGAKVYPHMPKAYSGAASGRPDLTEYFSSSSEEGCGACVDHLQESAVPMGSETHGGEDVGIWAGGPRAYLLRGTVEQHVVFHLMDRAFGFDEMAFPN